MSVADGTGSAEIGSGNITVAIGDSLEASVIYQQSGTRATQADRGGGIGAIVDTSGNVSDYDADFAVSKVVSLLATDAVSFVVDPSTMSVATTNT